MAKNGQKRLFEVIMAKSAETKMAEAESAKSVVKPPSGTKFTAAERKLWKLVASQRLEWDDAELVSLVRFIRLDTEINQCQERIDDDGLMIMGASGNLVSHPLLKIKAQSLTLSNQILRLLGIYNKDTRALNTATSEAKRTNATGDDDDLLG